MPPKRSSLYRKTKKSKNVSNKRKNEDVEQRETRLKQLRNNASSRLSRETLFERSIMLEELRNRPRLGWTDM